jgi:glycosyltransferase involved in cell wall biosynthesis
MVTQRKRIGLARRAIECFRQQDYPAKELVVVSDDDVSELGVPFHQVPTGLVLGDLRNLAIGRAHGQFLAQWDDDDIHHPERLSKQIKALTSNPAADGCALQRWTVAWPARNLYAISNRRAWEGSILARRWRLPAYPSLARGEDIAPIASMRLVLLDEPHLYVYVIHGDNTFDEPHFQAIIDSADVLEGQQAQRIAVLFKTFHSG